MLLDIVKVLASWYDFWYDFALAPLRLWKLIEEERGKRAIERRFRGFFDEMERRRQVKNDPLEE